MSPMPALQLTPNADREALEWFSLLRQPDCTEQQRQAFARWQRDPTNAQAYVELERCWQHLAPPPARPRPRQLKTRRSYLGKTLAALFLLILAALAYLYWPMMQRLASELHTAAGERRSVRLADGSTMHLDSASAMNADLRGRTRQLQVVQGQVSIDVVLDGRALEVQVGQARIQVYGTRLMIARSSAHDELVVLNGKAMIIQGADQRLLSAGERVTFTEQRIDPVHKADLQHVEAWRNGHLQVKDQPLGSVLERLAGYQGKRVWLMDEQTAYRRVSGDFNLDRAQASLDQVAAEQQLQLYSVFGQWLIAR